MRNDIIDFRNRQSLSKRVLRLIELSALSATSLGCYLVGAFYHILILLFPSKHEKPKRIVILGFGGIGNHLLLIPAVTSIKKNNTNLIIHLIASSSVCADLLKENPDIDSISVMNIGQMTRLFQYIKAGKILKQFKPDAIVAAAGTNPVAGSVIALFSKAYRRVGEDWKGRGALYTHKIRVNPSTSELQQNMRLVKVIGGALSAERPRLYLTAKERQRAQQWIFERGIDKNSFILGVHPGSGDGQKWKRWNIENFIKVTRKITHHPNVRVIFFVGPDEMELKTAIENTHINSMIIYYATSSIRDSAALIECCDLFLSNDSGLRHIAIALNVSTVGIFGPTSVTKNHPGGEGHTVIFRENIRCRPCHYTRWWLACGESRPCLTKISVDQVLNTIYPIIKK